MPTLPNIAFTQLRALATPLGLRIEEDGAGFPVIHGKYGRVLWFDGDDLLITADGPTWGALDAIPGLRRHGDNAALFPPHAFAAVADVIRAHRRPTLTPEQARKMARQTRRAKQARRARARARSAATLVPAWSLALQLADQLDQLAQPMRRRPGPRIGSRLYAQARFVH